ncbi:zinc finger BED domain-containing protein RICESLEEPER 2-like [Humulus lupulus]|uniref:zinc finger BED domain-containing protein RICESLEEPER 2-like n=1 Tax=Humulus lupulus TaxID=3486 RepID=UPI002B409EE0|nr:zinc finger BED domain-containing protein RICESLEEPER 2-like [Humulus lupulus]
MDNEENLEGMMGEWLEYAETNLSSSDEEQAMERKKENFPSRFTVARDIYNAFLDQKKELKSILKRIINFIQVPSHKGDLVGKELINCLNEWVTDGLKELNDAISSIRNAMRYVQSSPARLKRFKESCKDANIESKALLCLDVVTRWNSTYLMLESTIKFKKAFENLEADANYTK